MVFRKLIFLLLSAKNSSFSRDLSYQRYKTSKFKVQKVEFNELNNIVDNSMKMLDSYKYSEIKKFGMDAYIKESNKQHSDLNTLISDLDASKKYLIKNINNKRVIYFSIYNTTEFSNLTDLEFAVVDPIAYVFVQVIPWVNVLSIEGILLFHKSNQLKNYNVDLVLYVTKTYFNLLSNHSNLTLDYQKLKYFSNGRFYLDYSCL